MSSCEGVLKYVRFLRKEKCWFINVSNNELYVSTEHVYKSFKGFWAGAILLCKYDGDKVTHITAARVPLEDVENFRTWLKSFFDDLSRKGVDETSSMKSLVMKEYLQQERAGDPKILDIFHHASLNNPNVNNENWAKATDYLNNVLKCYESLQVYADLSSRVQAYKRMNATDKRVDILTDEAIKRFSNSINPGTYSIFIQYPYYVHNHDLKYNDAFAIVFETLKIDRTRGICYHILKNKMMDGGHTCMLKGDIIKTFSVKSLFVNEITKDDIINDEFTIYEIDEKEYVYLTKIADCEESIALDIVRLAESEVVPCNNIDDYISSYEAAASKELHEKQKYAIRRFFTETNVLIITGGPGTGKSTIIDCIEYCFMERNIMTHEGVIERCAPTGKAARRINGKTIHRLLKPIKDVETNKMVFEYTANKMLDCRLLTIDESSMIDVELGSALFQAIKRGTKVVILGDVNQLPSVGPGKVLYSFVKSGCIPRVHLTHCFRNEGSIAKLSHAIKNYDSSRLNEYDGDDVTIRWIKEDTTEEA